MRIIGGTHSSVPLKRVNHNNTRETKDRVKESIFNSISPYLYEATVLDLFAGSGALGLEACSRGSKHITFVDQDYKAVHTINDNIKKIREEKKTRVIQQDYQQFLKGDDTQYDVILLDPPYSINVLPNIIEDIIANKRLTEKGILICLYSSKDSINIQNFAIMETKKKRYGATTVSWMKWRS